MKVADQKSRPSSQQGPLTLRDATNTNMGLLDVYRHQSRPGKSQQEDLQYDDSAQVQVRSYLELHCDRRGFSPISPYDEVDS